MSRLTHCDQTKNKPKPTSKKSPRRNRKRIGTRKSFLIVGSNRPNCGVLWCSTLSQRNSLDLVVTSLAGHRSWATSTPSRPSAQSTLVLEKSSKKPHGFALVGCAPVESASVPKSGERERVPTAPRDSQFYSEQRQL